MAKMTVSTGEEFLLKLSRLSAGMASGIAKKAIYKGAGCVADEIKQQLHNTVSEEATGDLEASIGITTMEQDANGDWNAKIGFDGYDRNGTPNQLKARVLESGSSTRQKHPFIRPAVNRAKPKAEALMEQVIKEETEKIMKD